MSQIHAMIRESSEKTDQAYQAEKHAQLLSVLAGLLAPHLDQLIEEKTRYMAVTALNNFILSDELDKLVDRRVKHAIDDLNGRDVGLIRSIVRDELEDQADDFENRVNEIIDEREYIDSDDVDDKIVDRLDEVLRERELVRKDELDDKIAEVLGTFAEGDTMREKIQDALADMTGSFTLSRY